MVPSALRHSSWSVLSSLLLATPLVGCDSFDFGRVVGKPSAHKVHEPKVAIGSAPPSSPASKPPERAASFVVAVGGAVALGGNVGSFLAADTKYDPLAGLRPMLDGANFRMATLVSPIGPLPAKPGTVPVGAVATAAGLGRSGLHALLAGDELWSSGSAAFTETLANLDRAHVATAGASAQPNQERTLELTVDGWSVAVIAVTTWPAASSADGKPFFAPADPARVAARVREARSGHDLVLVAHHGGPERADAPSAEQTALARQAVLAGADAVFDQHSSMPLGVGFVSEHPVFYGLGNLVAEADPREPWTGRSFLARIAFTKGEPPAVDVCPYIIVEGEPKPFGGPSRATQEGVFARALTRMSDPLGKLELGDPDLNSCVRVSAGALALAR